MCGPGIIVKYKPVNSYYYLPYCVSCSRILIDTGSGGSSEYVTHLKEVLSNNESSIQEILVTHWHPDHVGGIPDVLKCTENPSMQFEINY